ncbi:MAG: GTP pyrophosphokinase family protein [Lachnospiraceae bacterium]|nr:GTP pyrophosphokinase family protein [Lachnospiraceae bacterium]
MVLPDLRDVVTEYKGMLLLYRSAIKEMTTRLEILGEEYRFSQGVNPIRKIESRIKSDENIVRKLQRKGKEISVDNIQAYVEDVAGIKVLCRYTTDIYRIVDLISSQKGIEVLKAKDYQLEPKMSGYRSYHMIVAVPVNLSGRTVSTKVEIQIHTMAMDVWSELEYEIGFRSTNAAVSEHTLKALRECADMIQYLDKKMLEIKEEFETE